MDGAHCLWTMLSNELLLLPSCYQYSFFKWNAVNYQCCTYYSITLFELWLFHMGGAHCPCTMLSNELLLLPSCHQYSFFKWNYVISTVHTCDSIWTSAVPYGWSTLSVHGHLFLFFPVCVVSRLWVGGLHLVISVYKTQITNFWLWRFWPPPCPQQVVLQFCIM